MKLDSFDRRLSRLESSLIKPSFAEVMNISAKSQEEIEHEIAGLLRIKAFLSTSDELEVVICHLGKLKTITSEDRELVMDAVAYRRNAIRLNEH